MRRRRSSRRCALSGLALTALSVVVLAFGDGAAFADISPPGCYTNGVSLSVSRSGSSVQAGATIAYYVRVRNGLDPAEGHCDVVNAAVTLTLPDGTTGLATGTVVAVAGPGQAYPAGAPGSDVTYGPFNYTVPENFAAVPSRVTAEAHLSGEVRIAEVNDTVDSKASIFTNVVNAWIEIDPATATNNTGTSHVLTITVHGVNGTVAAGTAAASLVSGPGVLVGSPTCNYPGGGTSASCTVTITSSVPGTNQVEATSTIGVDGQPVTRATSTATNDSAAGHPETNATATWVDATPPTITAPADIVTGPTGPSGAVVTFTITASDPEEGAVTPVCTSSPTPGLSSGASFPLGTTTITCNASDSAANAALPKAFTISIAATDTASNDPGPGGSVATSTEPTPSDPYATSVTTPTGGQVSIAESPSSGPPPTGFAFLGQQVQITAPAASAAQPLVFVFLVDASELSTNMITVDDIQMFHNGVGPLPDCTDSSQAIPDPCVGSRTTPAGGDGRIEVRSSTNGSWSLARPTLRAADDTESVPAHSPASEFLDLLANDLTPPFAQIIAVSQGSSGGTVIINQLVGRSVYYTPPAGFVGTDTFTYTIADDGRLSSATVAVAVTRAQQAITFLPLPTHLVDKNNYATPEPIAASSTSGLLVTLTSSTTSVCTVTGPAHAGGVTTWMLTVKAVGTCTLTATQGGTSVYYPANPVTRSFQVARQLIMGPQAMEGDMKVAPGVALKVGYGFKIPGSHPATYVSFLQAKAVFTYTCTSGPNSGSFTVTIPDVSNIFDDVNSSAWYPSDNQSDPSVYQASIVVPNVCPGGSLVRLQKGGTFSAGITSTGTARVMVRWHYSANGSAGGWSGTASVIPS